MSAEGGYRIELADDLDCRYEPAPWDFAEDYRTAIERRWAEAVAERPKLFNGRVLMLTRGAMVRQAGRAVFRGAYAAVDFKAFLAWRDLGRPVRGFRNGFGMAALQAEDGGFVLGEMADHTANAGLVYFPSGTPDPGDIVGDTVDIAGSIARELTEETGLDPARLAFDTGFTLIGDNHRVCVMQRVRAPGRADELVDRIHATLALQDDPELVRMHIVRSVADLTPAMPAFVTAYLRRAFASGGSAGAGHPG